MSPSPLISVCDLEEEFPEPMSMSSAFDILIIPTLNSPRAVDSAPSHVPAEVMRRQVLKPSVLSLQPKSFIDKE